METPTLVLDQYLILGDDFLSIINKYFQNSLLILKEKVKNIPSDEEHKEMGSLIMIEEFHLLLLVTLTFKTIKFTLYKPNVMTESNANNEERLSVLADTYLKTYETLFSAE